MVVLNCQRNAGTFTYDGLDCGAERVCQEIEQRLDQLRRDGIKITKFSIVGYSLGGVVARYVIGLLYHKGLFNEIQPVNFTTFATPHVGSRAPLTGYRHQLWNTLGARTLSKTGQQLFLIDDFRSTGRNILSVMADPESIFIHALAQFPHRTIYTNIVNDRSAVYYTTSISRTDPYTDLKQLDLHYIKGYEPVLLDPDRPYDILPPPANQPTLYQRISDSTSTLREGSPRLLLLTVLLPLGVTFFLLNSLVQDFRSRQRMLLHERDRDKLGFGVYGAIPWMMRDVQANLGVAFEPTNLTHDKQFLDANAQDPAEHSSHSSTNDASDSSASSSTTPISLEKPSTESSSSFPTLALTPAQFAMIQSLDNVGFRKYPVHIHKGFHSHAAIIRRSKLDTNSEGEVVIGHWLDNVFVL